MENNDNNNCNTSNQQGTKNLMMQYLAFLRNMQNKNPDEVENTLRQIIEIFANLSDRDLFCDECSESQKFFTNEFAPDLLRILLNESAKNANLTDLIQELLFIYAKEFNKALDNITAENAEFNFNLWEKIENIFNDDYPYYKAIGDTKDAADFFLDYIYEKLNPHYSTWRDNLKPNDYVDYLYKESSSSSSMYKGLGICNWTRAQILSIDANRVAQMKLLGTDDVFNLSLTSHLIMPYKSLSLDYEWRETIQAGDEIDYLDNKSWYRSTALETSETSRLSKSNNISYPLFSSGADLIFRNKLNGTLIIFQNNILNFKFK